jgi:hypothetical protein
MSLKTRLLKAAALVVPLSLALAACSADDVEFNGGIFDAVGLSDTSKVKAKEPKLAERAPLVVPPTLDKLPQPGSQSPNEPQIADIKDPDAAKVASKEEMERRQAEYCKVNYDQAMARGDETTALNAVGPLGPCRASVLTSFKKWNASEDE